jgi:hypothetical protein
MVLVLHLVCDEIPIHADAGAANTAVLRWPHARPPAAMGFAPGLRRCDPMRRTELICASFTQ